MGRQTRPVYICDLCGTETLESRDVRKIIGNISDGEGQHNYIGPNFIKGKRTSPTFTDMEIDQTIGDTQVCSNMYCLKCLPKALKLDETEQDREVVDILKKRVETTSDKLIDKAREELIIKQKEESLIPDEDVDEDFEDTSQRLDNILDDIDDDEEESIFDEEEEEEKPIIQPAKNGKYHVLGKIKDEEGEVLVAKFYQFNNVGDMRKEYGGPLIGIYATTGRYVDEIPEAEYTTIKVIVNAMMGIPNVADVDCYANDTFAFVEKDDLDELMGKNIEADIVE